MSQEEKAVEKICQRKAEKESTGETKMSNGNQNCSGNIYILGEDPRLARGKIVKK